MSASESTSTTPPAVAVEKDNDVKPAENPVGKTLDLETMSKIQVRQDGTTHLIALEYLDTVCPVECDDKAVSEWRRKETKIDPQHQKLLENYPELVSKVTKAINECGVYLKTLAGASCTDDDTDKPILWKMEESIEEMYAKSETSVAILRTHGSLTLTGDSQKNGAAKVENVFSDLELFDLSIDEVRVHHDSATIAQFENTEPRKSGVRLIMLELPVFCSGKDGKDINMILQLYAYYIDAARVQPPPEKKSAGEGSGTKQKLSASSLENNVVENSSGAEKHFNVVHTFFGCRLVHKNRGKEMSKQDQLVADRKYAAINAANVTYMREKVALRKELIVKRLHDLTNFVMTLQGAHFVERYAAAKPNFPPRAYLRLTIENSGKLIDLDQCVIADERDVAKRIADAKQVVAKLKAQFVQLKKFVDEKQRKDKESSGNTDKEAKVDDNAQPAPSHEDLDKLNALQMMLQDETELLKSSELILQRLKKCDAESQMLLHVHEIGTYQDRGLAVDMMFAVTIPIERMAQLFASDELKQSAAAGTATNADDGAE